jgi:hypothetical protein
LLLTLGEKPALAHDVLHRELSLEFDKAESELAGLVQDEIVVKDLAYLQHLISVAAQLEGDSKPQRGKP